MTQDAVQECGRGITALMHGDDIVLHADAGRRTELDAGGFEGGGNDFQGFAAWRRMTVLDGLDRGMRHAGSTGEIGLAPFEKGTGGTNLSVVYHGVSISS